MKSKEQVLEEYLPIVAYYAIRLYQHTHTKDIFAAVSKLNKFPNISNALCLYRAKVAINYLREHGYIDVYDYTDSRMQNEVEKQVGYVTPTEEGRRFFKETYEEKLGIEYFEQIANDKRNGRREAAKPERRSNKPDDGQEGKRGR